MECYTVPQILQLVRTPGPPSSEAREILSNTLAVFQYQQYVYNEDHQLAITAIESLHAPWRRLPFEVLSDIFTYCLPKDTKLHVNEAPFLLTRVCWTWYRAATTISNLWSNIILPEPSPNTLDTGTDYFRISILRARGVPLHILLHPEFIAHPASYQLIKQSSRQIQSLSIHYPTLPDDDMVQDQYFNNSPGLSTPNLASLEIISAQHLALSDFTHLQYLVHSSHDLKRYIFCSHVRQDFGPIPTTWSSLEELRLTDPMPFLLCSQILRSAPSLRKASFSFISMTTLPSAVHEDLPLPTSPFTHPNLETLLMGHYQSAFLTYFFDTFTLPRLRNLLLHNMGQIEVERTLPHQNLMNFLRRSNCLITTLDLYFELLTPSQLIELLETPMMKNTLTELSIQSDENFPAIIDEHVLEKLTLPPPQPPPPPPPPPPQTPPSSTAPSTDVPTDKVEAPASIGLCPNLEMFGMHSCFDFNILNFTKMLKSRLDPEFYLSPPLLSSPSPSSSPTIKKPKTDRRYLKYLETDMEPSLAAYDLKPLFARGLLTVLYDSSPVPQRLPLAEEEKKLLRRYFSEGVVLWEYDPDLGDWGPKDGILDSV